MLIKHSKKEPKSSLAVFSDNVTPEIEDITLRLLKMLGSKEESNVLGTQILRELFYRIAIGENSHFLHKMFLNSNTEAKISILRRSNGLKPIPAVIVLSSVSCKSIS